jgi:glycosyltransferase involved in cell wall biosynthesis
MKVVLLHDWLVSFRGGERVLEAFCEMFPEAPIYTLVYKPGSTSEIIEQKKIIPSFLNSIPKIWDYYRYFIPFFPKAVELMRIKERPDLILSSSHCVIKGIKAPVGSKHLSYIHSPMRYLYDQYPLYFGRQAPLYQRIGARIFKNYLVKWDLESNKNVHQFIANGLFVKERVKKYYGLDAKVINPFVDLNDFRPIKENTPIPKENYFLIVSAFAPNKRVDLAIKAFNSLKLELRIVGSGQQEKWLKSLGNKNIKFLGNLPRKEVIYYLSKARALIFPGIEDFGITPLEAMASGCPVIAFKMGGVLETLDSSVAEFFDEATPLSLEMAVKRFIDSEQNFKRENLINKSYLYSKESFKVKMMSEINKLLKK